LSELGIIEGWQWWCWPWAN